MAKQYILIHQSYLNKKIFQTIITAMLKPIQQIHINFGGVRMKIYIVLYTYKNSSLFADYEEIQGKTAIDAARKYVNDNSKTVKRSGDSDVNLCLVEGQYNKDNNTIRYKGNKVWYKVS
mgnify:FL=1